MKDPDQILLEGRERRARREKLLRAVCNSLGKSTRRRKFAGIVSLLGSLFLFWYVMYTSIKFDTEMGMSILTNTMLAFVAGGMVQSAIIDLVKNPSDVALRDLLEKELEGDIEDFVREHDDPDPVGVARG